MAFHRSSLLALVPISLVACGGSTSQPTPEGTHYHTVANKISVPTNNNEAREYGLDLNNDGTVDNQLGMVLGTLAGMGFDIQGTIDKAVAEGTIILLSDFQTKDFTNTTAAGIEVFLGMNPQPPACSSATDMYTCTTATPPVCTGCGHHLDGTGMFAVDTTSTNAALAGAVINGTFKGGPGDLTLQIALGGTAAISLDLIGARAQASSITATAIGTATDGGVIFAGALTQDDLNTKVIPAIQQELIPIIARDCTMLSSPPGCGCVDGSTGKTILGLFDTSPKDCAVSVMEIQTNSLIMSLLAPDVTIEGKMALSLGIKATTVGATYSPPGETM